MKTISMQINVSVPDEVSDDDAKRVIGKILSIGQQEAHDSVAMDGEDVFPDAQMATEFKIYNPSTGVKKVLVVVTDGVADVYNEEGVYVEVVDADAGDIPSVEFKKLITNKGV